MQKGSSYKMSGLLVRQYDGIKYLSFCDGASKEEVPDISDVEVDEEGEDYESAQQPAILSATGEIKSVLSLSDYSTCIVCTGSIKNTSPTLAKCTKCNAVMKVTDCNNSKSAKLLISNKCKRWFLTIYSDQLQELIQGVEGATTEEKLLNTTPFSFDYYTMTNVIHTINKI